MSLRFQKFDYVDLSYSVPREKPVLLKCPNKGSRKTVPLQKKKIIITGLNLGSKGEECIHPNFDFRKGQN